VEINCNPCDDGYEASLFLFDVFDSLANLESHM
jgi:hypothetical protein